jgi:outer membrane receptor protein involved in Fe transport
MQGNARLIPEQTWHGELMMQLHPNPWVQARLSGYLRRIDGFIRLDPNPACGSLCRNVNLDTINVSGLETGIDLFRDRIFGGGAMYLFQDQHSPTLGSQPIPNLPNHRIDAYLASTWKRRLGAMLRMRWISERIIQGVTLDRFYTFDLYTWARLSKNFRASVHIDNLTNSKYLQLPGLQALPTTVTVLIDGAWD